MKKQSAFTLRSGNKPSVAKFMGVSPMKVDLTKKSGTGPREDNKIRVSNEYDVGDFISEDDLEKKFKRSGDKSKNYPQLSVQDYSKVKRDDMGLYVEKL